MDDRQIGDLDNEHLAVLAGMEESLRAERDAAKAAVADEERSAPRCEKCKHVSSPRLKGLRQAWEAHKRAWGAAERARLEVARRIDPDKQAQRKAADEARRKAVEVRGELKDARRVFDEARVELAEAEANAGGDVTLVREAEGARDEALARVEDLTQQIAELERRQASAIKLLAAAIDEFVAKHRPKGKALEKIEQELRGAIFPKLKAEAKRGARASAQV